MFRPKPNLPSGYNLVSSSIEPEELYRLFCDVELFDWQKDLTMSEQWEELLREAIVPVGVRNRRKKLIGIGFLNGDREHATLCDLAVHPEHRHQGIGRAIVKERVEIAEQLGVRELGTNLVASNTLKPFYLELGFKAVGSIFEKRFPAQN